MDPMFTKGFDPTKTYDLRALDSINTFNGNLVVTVPLTQTFRVSPTLSYGWTAVYNSRAWDAHPISAGVPQSCEIIDPDPNNYGGNNDVGVLCQFEQALTAMLPCRRCNAGLGWVVSMGRLVPPEDPTNEMTASDRGFLYEGPDGREHPFSSVGANAEPPYTTYSTDESRLRLHATLTERIVDFPDGTTQIFEKLGPDNNEPWRLIDYYDRFENHIYIHYEFPVETTTGNTLEVWTVKEVPNGYDVGSPLRTHTLTFTFAPAGSDRTNKAGVLGTTWSQSRLTSITTTAFGGHTATVTLSYTRAAVPRNTSDTMGSGGLPGYAPNQFLLTSVTLPDPNETYAMPLSSAYDLCPPNGGCIAGGLLRSLTLPTKGKISWTYEQETPPVPVLQTPPVPNEPGPQFPVQIKNAAVSSRVADDGSSAATWYYHYQPLTETCYTESDSKEWWHFRQLASGVTAPDGTTTMSYYSIYRFFDPCDDEGWSQVEYGLPFTRHVSVGKDPSNPNDTGRLFLSTEVYSNTAPSAPPSFIPATTANAGFGQASDNSKRLQPQGGVLQRQTYVEYTYVTSAGGSAYKPDHERTYDGTTHFTESVRSNPDAYGHFRQTTVGGNLGTPLYRTSFTNYIVPATGPTTSTSWLFDTFSERCSLVESSVHGTVSNCAALGSGATTATFSLQKFCFDPEAPGFLTRLRTVRGTSPANGDFLSIFSKSSTGEVETESYFGGDDDNGAAVDFGQDDFCSASYTPKYKINHTYIAGTLAASQYDASDFYTVDRDIDTGTGLVSKARDSAGNATSYSYDLSGRLTTVTPPSGATTTVTYDASVTPPTVEVTRGSGDTGTDEVTYFDGLGRVKQTRKEMPGGWSTISTAYEPATGKISSVTLPIFKTSKTYSAVSGNATTYAYDFLGRLTRTALPDGTATTAQYVGVESAIRTQQIGTSLATDGSVSLTPETTTETYDALGRLRSVKEKSDGDVTTTYDYDVADRLTNASTTGSGATQNRTFTYDGAGNLTKEQHPELDSSGKTYSSIDARGHARITSIGTGSAFTSSIALDSAERITSLKDGSGNLLKAFAYGGTNDGNTKGRLKSATRHNLLASGTDMIVSETYGYDTVGRVTDRDTAVNAGTTQVQTFHQHFTYDALGDMTTMTYPQATSFGGSPAITDVTQRYTNGFLVAVPGYAGTTTTDGISYSAHGLVQSVVHGDEHFTKDTYSVDSSNLPRFGAIELATPCTAPSATISAPSGVCPNSQGNVASAPTGDGLTYAWTISGGTITSGATTSSVAFAAGVSGAVTLGVTVSKDGCSASSSKVVASSAPVANVSGSSTVATGSSTTILATLTGTPPWNLMWSDGHVQNNVLSSPASYTLTPTNSTTITVQNIGDANCASGSVTGPGWTITVGTLPDAPSNVQASTTSATSVRVTWSLANGATSYDVLRASTLHEDVAGTYSAVGHVNSSTALFDDITALSQHSYIYRVRAVNSVGTRLSSFRVATTVPFHDHDTVTATDFTELRAAVIAMQTLADIQPPIAFPNDIYTGAPILLSHLTSLRNGLDDARRNLGLPAIAYAEPTANLVQWVTTIKHQHVLELRGGVQ